MPGAEQLALPGNYSLLWPLLGMVLLAAVAGYLAWAVRSTRAGAPAGRGGRRRTDGASSEVRARYLRDLEDLERRFDVGDVDSRALHQELSVLVRAFAEEVRGLPALTLTAADLRKIGKAKRLARIVERYYEPAFATSSKLKPQTSISEARKLVDSW